MRFSLKSILVALTAFSLALALYAYETKTRIQQDLSYQISVEVVPHAEHETRISYVTIEKDDLQSAYIDLTRWRNGSELSGKPELMGFAVDDFKIQIPIMHEVSPILTRRLGTLQNHNCVLFFLENELGSSITWRKGYLWDTNGSVTIDIPEIVRKNRFRKIEFLDEADMLEFINSRQ